MRIFRHGVPVDEQWHTLFPVTDPLSVGCRDRSVVEFWSWEPHGDSASWRFFRVYGTGQEIPENVKHWGTAVAPDGFLVWHLFEATGELAERIMLK